MDISPPEQKKEYLLDTGVFIALTKPQLEILLESKPRIKLTAGLIVPFELISGIPSSKSPDADQKFHMRQAALSKYASLVGTAGTYWDEPRIIRKKSFGVATSDRLPASFQLLIKACTECKSISEVEEVIAKANAFSSSMPSLDRLRQQADTVSQGFRDSFKAGNNTLKNVAQSQIPHADQLSTLERKKIVRGFIPYLQDVGDLRTYAFLSIAEVVGAWNGQLPSNDNYYEECKRAEQKLRNHYDGSIDLYITAFAEYLTEKWLDGGDPHRNDPFDLDHIVYLRSEDENQVLVTTDDKFLLRCLKTVPDRAISISVFLNDVKS
jgi:hypothetical protein